MAVINANVFASIHINIYIVVFDVLLLLPILLVLPILLLLPTLGLFFELFLFPVLGLLFERFLVGEVVFLLADEWFLLGVAWLLLDEELFLPGVAWVLFAGAVLVVPARCCAWIDWNGNEIKTANNTTKNICLDLLIA